MCGVSFSRNPFRVLLDALILRSDRQVGTKATKRGLYLTGDYLYPKETSEVLCHGTSGLQVTRSHSAIKEMKSHENLGGLLFVDSWAITNT